MDKQFSPGWFGRPAAQGRRLWAWWKKRRHLRKMKGFYAQFIRPGALVFDVGAHTGNRTRLFLELGARVVAVEPQTACARRLFLAFHDNPNFSLVPKALGATESSGELFLSERTVSATLSRQWVETTKPKQYGKIGWSGSQTVQITTLDALIREFGLPSFVKIDAEFSEHNVLRGLSQALPAFSFEFHLAYLEPALHSIAGLSRFQPVELNLSRFERFDWVLAEWTTPEAVSALLQREAQATDFQWGDVYVRTL